MLYWIEVLALMENLGVGVYALNDVEQWCASVSSAQIAYQVLYSHSLHSGRHFVQVD